MEIDVKLEPYCKDCLKIELETHHAYRNDDLILVHVCKNRCICENAIWQHEGMKHKDPYYKHESVKVYEKENQNGTD